MLRRIFFTHLSKAKASDADIAKSESLFGFKLPYAFREFCHKYNGGFVGEGSEFYSVPEKFSDYYAEYLEGGILLAVFYGLTTDPEHAMY